MRRRDFITLLGSATAFPSPVVAGQMRRIGVLMAFEESDPEGSAWVAALREELQTKWPAA